MALKTDSNAYTIIFAVVMVVVVGSILALVASNLKEQIAENQEFEKQQNILYAMGVNNDEEKFSGSGSVQFIPTQEVMDEYKKYVKRSYILAGGEIIESDSAFYIQPEVEKRKMEADPSYDKKMALYVGELDNKEYYVIPMRGKGLWDVIWGYMALNKDYTVQGVYFDHKGETPGLGANIKERFFMDDFHGEKVVNENKIVEGIAIAKGNMDPTNERKNDYKVDALAGATITGDGVAMMINATLKEYYPYLEKLNNLN